MSDAVATIPGRRNPFDQPPTPPAMPAPRPPRPPRRRRDWRWTLGLVGRVLVTVGALMFAFVAYQLWGTGIQTAREQARLRHEFADALETTVPLTSLPPTTVAVTVATTVAPETTIAPPPASTVPAAVVTAPAEGDAVAQLAIPRMGVERKIVVEGVTPSALQDGPGHFPETPLPGQLGNSAIAGHRTTHGAPFRQIDELRAGDEITVTTLAGTYIYVVTEQMIVEPSDYSLVIPTRDPTVATLTLTSCHPERSTRQRIVVVAELDVIRSSPVTQPTPLDSGAPAALPGEELPAATNPAPDTAPPTVPDTAPPTVPESVPDTVADTVPDAGRVRLDGPPADSAEVFANDWFSDPDAFAQVALWGAVLTVVSLAAWLLSRRAGRNWVGALAGIGPFTVALYFFFENVNRLLPPNL